MLSIHGMIPNENYPYPTPPLHSSPFNKPLHDFPELAVSFLARVEETGSVRLLVHEQRELGVDGDEGRPVEHVRHRGQALGEDRTSGGRSKMFYENSTIRGDAKWIVIRGQLRGHNDTPCGRPTPSWPIGRPGVVRPQGVFGGFSYY
jgi:hypothetical protein